MRCGINSKYITIEDYIKSIPDIFENEGKVIYSGRNIVKTFEYGGQLFNVKRFKVPNIVNRIAYRYFRKSKALRSFEYANKLLDFGINTPEPVAFIEFSNLVGLKYSYYISMHVDYDITFRELIGQDISKIKDILIQFTEFTWKLHDNGVYFIDHSPGNTLISKDDNGYVFSLVDLNRTKFFKDKIDVNNGIRNFYRLGSTPEMVEVMAEEYARLRNVDVGFVKKTMMEQTMAHNKAVIAKEARRTRNKK